MSSSDQIIDYTRCRLIACATVLEEMLPILPPGLDYLRMDFGLHADPDKLRLALQEAINAVPAQTEHILLGYGLCSRALTGLTSPTGSLVIPRIDDCIGIFLGSDSEYQAQHRLAPGTLYQTKGWIEADRSIPGLDDLVKKYGETRARSLLKQMIKNYTRLAFINTGNYAIDHYRELSRKTAAEMELQFEEIPGSNRLVKKLLYGPWDSEFVIAPAGTKIVFADFR